MSEHSGEFDLVLFKKIVRLISLFISVLCGGYVFHDYVTKCLGIWSMLVFIVFVIFSLLTILIARDRKFKCIHKRVSSFVIWAICMFVVFGCIFTYNEFRNSSPVLYSAECFRSTGLYMDFRENGTFKARNEHMLDGSISYGKYRTIDSLIILENEVYWNSSKLKDTLIIKEQGIDFETEATSGLRSKTTMYFKYKKKE